MNANESPPRAEHVAEPRAEPLTNPAPSAERKFFVLLLAAVTLAFGWILLPFFGAVFWGAVLAIVFAPLFRRFAVSMGGRRTLAALATLAVIVLIVILPLALIGVALVDEATTVFQRLRSGELNFALYFQQIVGALPSWASGWLDRVGLNNLAALQLKFTTALTQGSQLIAQRALDIGQNTLEIVTSFFVAMYLLFFLLRDGGSLARMVRDAIPLAPAHKRDLFAKFTTVIRATVKGNILVAVAQGALGGLAFWFLDVHAPVLWAALMAFLSLLPAIGAALIWLPVALYLLATGAVWQGIGLIVFGVVVIGLVDNLLRPLLVGKDTKMPDYVVLMSTLGGMAVFGLSGFVIGPVIAAMFIAVWHLFTLQQRQI